jgi:uncharacterized DUF497 family protein
VSEDYEWDEAKAASNLAKHGISFDEIVLLFKDAKHVVFGSFREADGENRFKAVGLIERSLYTVVFTGRGGARRLISGRRANRSEEKRYGDRSLQT